MRLRCDRQCEFKCGTTCVSVIRHTRRVFQSSTSKYDRTLAIPKHDNLGNVLVALDFIVILERLHQLA
jgi:hypothetical protein